MKRTELWKCVLWTAAFASLLFGAALQADQHEEEEPAEETESSTEMELDPVVTVGTRAPERSRLNSPAPVDVITEAQMRQTGHTELGRILQTLAPSFNFSSSSISDGTDALRPATLRGLGPDQALVLVNGKRRHGSALIHVNTSVGRGTAGVDMNAIPAAAIKRVEILRDGASAQYGTDAIAGVMNIVLKDDFTGGFSTSYGITHEGDGATTLLNAYHSLRLGKEGSLHIAAEFRDREATNRAGLTGNVQFPSTTLVEGSDPPMIESDPGSKEAKFDRLNFRLGDAASTQYALMLNGSMPVSGYDVYGFVDISSRNNESAGFYRRANQLDRNPEGSLYPDGFLPLINTDIFDYSIGVGAKKELDNGMRIDASLVTGLNTFDFNISNSHNASRVAANGANADETSADAGGLSLALSTANLDFAYPFIEAGHLAWGAEFRLDRYQIQEGEELSYEDYDGPGGAAAGIQVFPGFQPSNIVDESRTAISGYADLELNLSEAFLISPAVRVENYSDFGATANGKIAARLELTEELAFRSSISTGFRAPSMQQLYFNNVSTQFNIDPVTGENIPQEIGTFRNDSDIAKAIGIPELSEETAVNIGGGVIMRPHAQFTVTADVYRIAIEDRIIISGRVQGGDEAVPANVRTALASAGVAGAQFFMNAADTETNGMDVVATYMQPVGDSGVLTLSVAGNVTETEITDVNLPADLPESLFSEQDRSIIETWQPKDRFSWSARYRGAGLDIDLAAHRYGEYTVIDGGRSQTYSPKIVTDAQIAFNISDTARLKFGANNLFNATPDANKIGQARGGTILDANGNAIVDSPGVFAYSRRAAPFGFNGALYYVGWELAY
ncbi:MAG: TonB-dependent receptor [Candidatus Poribacteria bacterium]|nr:TonB-dependent receptor [Candidatus Poribacteria bacterium]